MAMKHKYLEPRAVARLQSLELVARLVVEGFISGRHRSPFHGFSVEFADHRQYVAGDDLRFLDWKVYGKQDRLYVKRFEEETNLRAHLLIDRSNSMAFTSGTLTKLEYSCYSAAALAYLMIRQRDAVGLATFDHQIHTRITPSSRRTQLNLILSGLDECVPGSDTDLAETLHELAERVRRRGLIVLFSDLLDEQDAVINALQHFRHKKHEVLVFHVMDPAEVSFPFQGVTRFRDMESPRELLANPALLRQRYVERFQAFSDYYREQCGRLKIDYIRVNTQTPYDEFLSEYLIRRSRLG